MSWDPNGGFDDFGGDSGGGGDVFFDCEFGEDEVRVLLRTRSAERCICTTRDRECFLVL